MKIVVPSTPGGGADTIARLLADHIGKTQNQSVVVENRPGASNTIGTEFVSRAAPDGNTVLISTPEFVINAHLRKLNYDPLTSFEPICYLARSPQLLAVNAQSPYRKLADLFDGARAAPGTLNLASAGPASAPHIAFETLKLQAKVDITYIPYQGSGPAVNALLGGHLTSVLASYPNLVTLVKDNKLRALASASLTRTDDLPEVPTIAELGFKDFEFDLWLGVTAPAKTPKDKVAELSGWFKAALDDPAIKAKLLSQGLFPAGICGAPFGEFVQKQFDSYGRAIAAAGIKAP
jgi:tripartite-type tricarboxylate transporter receptor subunit TctC